MYRDGETTIKRRKKRKRLMKIYSVPLALMIAVIFSMTVNTDFAKAEVLEENGLNLDKHYKSIIIEYGDTLWGIATEFKDSHYESVQDYIDEVMQINNLKTDRIHAGKYLTIPYYDDHHTDSSDENCEIQLSSFKKNY